MYKYKRILPQFSAAQHQDVSKCIFRAISSPSNTNESLPRKTKVVICGGGVMGASVAYHLSNLGYATDTIIVEQESSGYLHDTNWHSSGLVGIFKPSLVQVKLCQSTLKLYKELVSKGLDIGWEERGSLLVARTSDRMILFKRMKALSVSWDVNCKIITPTEVKDLCPLLETDDLKGGLWIPGDGTADPVKVTSVLLQLAKDKGLKIYDNCEVKEIIPENNKVKFIETSKGSVECEYFVNCGGLSARKIGKLSTPNVKVPVHSVEHYYLVAESPNNSFDNFPVIRDHDGGIYFREMGGRLLAGGFERKAKPIYVENVTTDMKLPLDWDHFLQILEQLLKRVPSLNEANFKQLTNYPESFSPDCKWIIGEAPEIGNYFVAAAMKTVGLAAAGGVGKATAEWIVHGGPCEDMYELDISRFLALHNNDKFLRDRVKEVPGLHYSILYPFQDFQTSRRVRMSPIYPKLIEAGAVFNQIMGYERPSWFEKTSERVEITQFKSAASDTFYKPNWFDNVKNEYDACRESIGLSDYSTYTKIDLRSSGTEVVTLLQYLCSNDVDVPVGSIIHTGMQNKYGGYENDCSLVRLADNYYMIIAPAIQQTKCKLWIGKHLPSDGSVSMTDVTSMFTAICIMGPFTRSLLAELTDVDLSPKSFPFFTYKELDIGFANGIRAMNITHTGELGYVLYVPNEFALHVYNCLLENGEKYGIKHVGHNATRTLRVEKFYAFWGQDLDSTTTPLECGRSWRVKFDKGINFIGREALLKQRENGVKRMYVQLILNDHDLEIDQWCWGNEPIYRDNRHVGATTTTSYGFTFKKQVCLGFVQNLNSSGHAEEVTNDYVLSGDYEVDIAGVRYSAKVNLHSPILPTKYPDKERESYLATRDKMDSEPLLRQ